MLQARLEPFDLDLRGVGRANLDARVVNVTDGPARFFAGGRIKFAANGRREGAPLVIVQWQNGEPVSVYPPETAFQKPIWTKQ